MRYVSSEEFTNEFINSIRDDKAAVFQRRYRDVDLLLVDDIQFLSGKVQTPGGVLPHVQHAAQQQQTDRGHLLTSTRQLPDFEDRMRSRFEWGLITDVQPPDLETRIAILRKKTNADGMNVPTTCSEYIADRISSNIRNSRVLIRVTAFASLNNAPVDRDLAQEVLKDLISDQSRPEVSAGLIMSETAQYYGFTIDDLCGPSRSRTPRWWPGRSPCICAVNSPTSPFPKVGQEFGPRPHHGHACRAQDPQGDRAAMQPLQPGHRPDIPDQGRSPRQPVVLTMTADRHTADVSRTQWAVTQCL